MKLQSLLKTLMIASCSVAFAFSQAMASDSDENLIDALPDDVASSTAVVPHDGSSDSKALVPHSLVEKRKQLEQRLAKARDFRAQSDEGLKMQVDGLNKTVGEVKDRYNTLERTADEVSDRTFDVKNKCALFIDAAQRAIVNHIFPALKKAQESGARAMLTAEEAEGLLGILKDKSIAITKEVQRLIVLLEDGIEEGEATVNLSKKAVEDAVGVLENNGLIC